MYHLGYAILITEDITIAYYRNTDMLLQVIYSCEVSPTCKCLLICASMYRDEIGTRILESLYELDEEIWILPTKTSLHGYWYLHSIGHLFYYLECCITVDHE